jgi:hypothetical protein
MKIKDFYLSYLSENENFFYADGNSVGTIKDVDINKKDDFVKIDFETTYGKPATLVVKYSAFKNWFMGNIDKFQDAFKAFVSEYFKTAKETETEEPVNEIVDDEGNIMSSDDKPNNATNSMIGSKNNWDLDKTFKSSIPKSIRFYSGDLGIGIITW